MRVLFLGNFASEKFCESKTLAKWRNHSVVYKLWPRSEFLTWQICLGSIGENKINAKISEFTVYNVQETKIFQYCTCPAGRVTYNFHSSCKQMYLPFKSLCNKEHKGVIFNMTSLSNSSQSTRSWKNYTSFLGFTCNYERTSGIFVICCI